MKQLEGGILSLFELVYTIPLNYDEMVEHFHLGLISVSIRSRLPLLTRPRRESFFVLSFNFGVKWRQEIFRKHYKKHIG